LNGAGQSPANDPIKQAYKQNLRAQTANIQAAMISTNTVRRASA
jgi:hypothetical protein